MGTIQVRGASNRTPTHVGILCRALAINNVYIYVYIYIYIYDDYCDLFKH